MAIKLKFIFYSFALALRRFQFFERKRGVRDTRTVENKTTGNRAQNISLYFKKCAKPKLFILRILLTRIIKQASKDYKR